MTHLLWSVLLLSAVAADHPAAAFVDRWHAALRGNDRAAVLDLMTKDVTIFESGEAENSRDEYAVHHLDADMKFARASSTTLENRQVVEMGDAVVVLSRTATAGTFEGKPVSSKGVETMVLRKSGWRLAHRPHPLVVAAGPPANSPFAPSIVGGPRMIADAGPGVLGRRHSLPQVLGSPATSMCIIRPPPPSCSVLLFVVWWGMWQWIIHLPGFTAVQITS